MVREKEANRTELLIREVRESTQKQVEALTMLIKDVVDKKDDNPQMIMFMQMMQESRRDSLEAARINAEAEKEKARIQAEIARESARNAIGPRELMDIVSRSNTGAEQMARGYAQMWDMGQNMIENVMRLQGPDVHPALAMLQDGLQNGVALAQQALELRQQQAAANAQAVERQQQIQTLSAQGRQEEARQLAEAVPEQDVTQLGEQIVSADEELFGPAWPSVQKLRLGVQGGMINPEQAVQALLKGIDTFTTAGEVVPAFALWGDRDFEKLVEVLVPGAPTSFKARFIEGLVAFVAANAHQGAKLPTQPVVAEAPAEVEVVEAKAN